MTRKRYVKLLMSMGCQRNTAERTAQIVRDCRSYEEDMAFEKRLQARKQADEIRRKYKWCRVGIDLANGPDMTARGGGGND